MGSVGLWCTRQGWWWVSYYLPGGWPSLSFWADATAAPYCLQRPHTAMQPLWQPLKQGRQCVIVTSVRHPSHRTPECRASVKSYLLAGLSPVLGQWRERDACPLHHDRSNEAKAYPTNEKRRQIE